MRDDTRARTRRRVGYSVDAGGEHELQVRREGEKEGGREGGREGCVCEMTRVLDERES